jgi:hypothetical protein
MDAEQSQSHQIVTTARALAATRLTSVARCHPPYIVSITTTDCHHVVGDGIRRRNK